MLFSHYFECLNLNLKKFENPRWRPLVTSLCCCGCHGNQLSSKWFSTVNIILLLKFLFLLFMTFLMFVCLSVETPVLRIRPMLQNQTLQKQPNSSVTMACNIYSAGIVRVVLLINGTNISNFSSVVTREPKSTFTSPSVTTLTVMYGNASLAKSTFKCREVPGEGRVLKCLSLAVECRAEDANGANVSSTSFIQLYNSLGKFLSLQLIKLGYILIRIFSDNRAFLCAMKSSPLTVQHHRKF